MILCGVDGEINRQENKTISPWITVLLLPFEEMIFPLFGGNQTFNPKISMEMGVQILEIGIEVGIRGGRRQRREREISVGRREAEEAPETESEATELAAGEAEEEIQNLSFRVASYVLAKIN
nr:hypothetical protein Iba_chr04dCG12910 [Ipomoea batatas]